MKGVRGTEVQTLGAVYIRAKILIKVKGRRCVRGRYCVGGLYRLTAI